MTRNHIGTAAAIIGLLEATAIPSVPALAASDNAATITKDRRCVGFVPDADGNLVSRLFSNRSQEVDTRSGNFSVICRFDIPEGQRPASATQADGFGCGTYRGTTYDTKMLATPGGRAILICNLNGNS